MQILNVFLEEIGHAEFYSPVRPAVAPTIIDQDLKTGVGQCRYLGRPIFDRTQTGVQQDYNRGILGAVQFVVDVVTVDGCEILDRHVFLLMN